MGSWKKISSPLIASLTLGLMPFMPEPHIVGKIRWIAGGAKGMEFMDWFDVVLHGFPWVWLLFTTIFIVVNKSKDAKAH